MGHVSEFLKRHQLVAYFVLTYAFTWTLELIFQPLYLQGQKFVTPLISLGIFGPALVSIGLSAMLKPGPRQGSRKSAGIAFVVVWLLASPIIILNLTVNEHMDLTTRLVIVSMVTALLPAFVASCIFSSIPGVRELLLTYRKPRGPFGYYLVAILLIPTIWVLGNFLSRAFGMTVPFFRSPVVDFKLLGMAILMFLYNVAYSALSEEPGWRGFALPRFQSKFNPLVSSLILGVLWSAWHIPLVFGGIEPNNPSDVLVEWTLIVFVNILFTWLFNRTKGSILVTALIHPVMNTTGSFLNASIGAIILLVGFTIFVIVFDKMWRKLPAENLAVRKSSF